MATPRKPGGAAIARGRLAQQLLADHRIQPIRADQQADLLLVPIGVVSNDMPWFSSEADAVRMHVDAPPIDGPCQKTQQISTMDAQTWGSHPPFEGIQSHASQSFPRQDQHSKWVRRALTAIRASARPRSRSTCTRTRPQGQTRPDLAQLRIALEDRDTDALA
jgi:hypothetical protein